MNVVIRTDASQVIGTGHVIRCLTLAEVLRNRGAKIHFICRLHGGHLCDLIEQHGFSVTRLEIAQKLMPTDINRLNYSMKGHHLIRIGLERHGIMMCRKQ